MKEFTIPEFEKSIVGYSFSWPDSGLLIKLERLNDDAKGEIGIYHNNGTEQELLKYARISLLDSRGIDHLTKSLELTNKELDWHRIMTYVTGKGIQVLREGQPVTNINSEPTKKRVTWTLTPWLPEKEPTTIFGPGGKGKSIFADMVAVLVTFGTKLKGLPYLIPSQGNVLYLDWERNEEVHKQRISAIKHSLGITDGRDIHYIKCDHPISSNIEYLCKIIVEFDITLVIIDSQMGATAGMGHGMSDAEVSSLYYNLIRRFNCTTLTIDHTTKTGMSEETTTETPFGSVVKYNRATSVYSVKATQETESDSLSLALKHEKFNLGRKQVARGIEIEFKNNEANELVGLSFHSFDLADNPVFTKLLPDWQIIASILKSGPKHCKDIAEEAMRLNPETKITAKRAYDVMNQKPRVFTKGKSSKLWGLLAQRDGL